MTHTSNTTRLPVDDVTERHGFDWLHQTIHWSMLSDAELRTLLADSAFVDEISSVAYWAASTEAGRRGLA